MHLYLLLYLVLLEGCHYTNTNLNFFPMIYLKDALTKYQEIINNLEFARDLQKGFMALGQEVSLEL